MATSSVSDNKDSTSAMPPASATVAPNQSASTGAASNGSQQQQPAAHANMHFDTQTGKWMYENTETGQEYEWNTVANAWAPVADEEELKKQQAAYSVAGVDEEVCAA